jgi:hypothetical protein
MLHDVRVLARNDAMQYHNYESCAIQVARAIIFPAITEDPRTWHRRCPVILISNMTTREFELRDIVRTYDASVLGVLNIRDQTVPLQLLKGNNYIPQPSGSLRIYVCYVMYQNGIMLLYSPASFCRTRRPTLLHHYYHHLARNWAYRVYDDQ